jgi:hypothetical protein
LLRDLTEKLVLKTSNLALIIEKLFAFYFKCVTKTYFYFQIDINLKVIFKIDVFSLIMQMLETFEGLESMQLTK